MLVAHNLLLQDIVARFADRSGNYRCPDCRGEVILKRGDLVTPHFAHRAAAGDCMLSDHAESEAHRAMKLWFYDKLRAQPWVRACYLERWTGGRRADVWLDTVRGSQVAIECQASGIDHAALQAKLIDYRSRGIKTLYALHAGVLRGWSPGAGIAALNGSIERVPAWVEALLFAYLDRFIGVRFAYVFDGGALSLLLFDPVSAGSRRHRVTVIGKVERFDGLIELRDQLLIIQGTEALLPHKAA